MNPILPLKHNDECQIRLLTVCYSESPTPPSRSPSRPRAATSAKASLSSEAKRSHSRVKSEVTGSSVRSGSGPKSPHGSASNQSSNSAKPNSPLDSKSARNLASAPSSRTAVGRRTSLSAATSRGLSKRQPPALDRASTTPNDSFLDMTDMKENESDDPSRPRSSGVNRLDDPQRTPTEAGYSFGELVDQLLSVPMSKQDTKFSAIFLCLYRKFATPADLLSGIIERFEALEKGKNAQLIRLSDQLRYLNILDEWVSEYPGDFAHPKVREVMVNFVAKLDRNRVFAFAAKEMNVALEYIVEDDDTGWANYEKGPSGRPRDRSSTFGSFLSTSSAQSAGSTAIGGDSSTEDLSSITTAADSNADTVVDNTQRHSNTPSYSSGTYASGSGSNSSFTALRTPEGAQREAQLLVPRPRWEFGKPQWHTFMDISDEDWARELTRMDWIMYMSVRPREFVRQVSLTPEEKERSKSLANINRMSDHFNHIAFFVASMILLRDKPKHRARALEKFMGIAWVNISPPKALLVENTNLSRRNYAN